MDSELAGPLCAFCFSAVWAVASTQYSKLAQDYSAFAVNLSRAVVGFPLFLITLLILSGGTEGLIESFNPVRASHWGWFALGIIGSYGLGDVMFLWSTRTLGVPGALAIASCYPIWTVLAGYLFLGDKANSLQFFGLIMTIFGIVTVVLNSPRDKSNGKNFIISRSGIAFAIAASISWATNSFAVARGGADLHPVVGNAVRMTLALLLVPLFSKIFSRNSPLFLPRKQLRLYLWIFVFEGFGGSLLYVYGLSHSSLTVGATLTSLAPVLSVPVAVSLGLERFSLKRTLGVCLAVAGIWILVSQ